jgi:hypothetical protein
MQRIGDIRDWKDQQIAWLATPSCNIGVPAPAAPRGAHPLARRTGGEQVQSIVACDAPILGNNLRPSVAQVSFDGAGFGMVEVSDGKAVRFEFRKDVKPEAGLAVADIPGPAV